MLNGTYYLNNSGHRWVVYKDGKKEKVILSTERGKSVVRTALYYEMFGNFAVVCVSYKGKKIKVFADQKLPD